MSSNSWNLKSPFLTIRCLYWRGRSASWLANMSSNNRNVKSPFLTAKCLYWGVFLPVNWPIWALTVEISSNHSWTLDASTGGRSASWLANMSSNNRNVKSPFLTAKCLYWGVFLPVNRPIWALTVEISSDHSWTLDASTGGRSASWLANMSSNNRNVKSPFLTAKCLYWGVFLPVDLPIWALTVEISNHNSWPLDASTGGRSANWSANICSNIRNLKSPFLTTRCLYWGVDLPVDWPILALTVEISSHHSWQLDASTSGDTCWLFCQYEL